MTCEDDVPCGAKLSAFGGLGLRLVRALWGRMAFSVKKVKMPWILHFLSEVAKSELYTYGPCAHGCPQCFVLSLVSFSHHF